MNTTTAQSAATAWSPPKNTPAATGEVLDAWRETTLRLREIAVADDLSKSEVSRRADVPLGTLSPWYDGIYTGSVAKITDRVRLWLEAYGESKRAMLSMPVAPGFVLTRTAKQLIEALLYAQTMPEFTVATLGAGCGKTETARHFASTRPHAYLVTMRPTTAGKHAMLQELALALDVMERNPARLDRAIGMKLKRNGRHTLVILDEAQNLADEAVNQLRYFLDEYGCGIALLGNEAVYKRFGGLTEDERKLDGEAQVQSRIGLRIRQRQPYPEDVEAILDAWNVEDEASRKLLRAIARKPGALRHVDKALKLGSMLAMGGGKPLSAEHIRQAWANRTGEDIR